jgi:hypothetical protein
MARWVEHMLAIGGGEAYVSLGELGTPDEDITTVLDTRPQLARRWEAIRAHASQASPWDDLPGDLQDDFLASDRLQLVRGDDLLAE